MPTCPNGDSESGSTTPLAPIDRQKFHYSRTRCQICLANHYCQYISTQIHAHDDTSTGTACSSTSYSTRSSTTFCGTSTCVRCSQRSGCSASTTSACLYSRKYTTICSTLSTHRAKPRVVFQSLKRLALDLPSCAVPDVLRTYPDSTGMSSRHRVPAPCLEITLLGGGMWKDCQPFRMPPSGSQVR